MRWYTEYFKYFERDPWSLPPAKLQEIKTKVEQLNSQEPLVSVVIIAYNEEKRLLPCVWSLSNSKTKYPFEIIGVDNNSHDLTSKLFKELGVRYFFEEKKGPGYSRQKGLEEARGKYIVCIDADTLYPPRYIETMIRELEKPNTMVVSSNYNYLPQEGFPRFWMRFYELFRDIHLYFLSFKNPVWCVRGAVMAHNAPKALEIGGYRVHLSRGEDGAMAYDLMEFGKISFIRGYKARAYTSTKALGVDGSIVSALSKRAWEAIKGVGRYFKFTGDSDPLSPKNREKL